MRKNNVLTKSISHHVPKIFRFLFCNMQMRCLMTSSTQPSANKLPQVRNT